MTGRRAARRGNHAALLGVLVLTLLTGAPDARAREDSVETLLRRADGQIRARLFGEAKETLARAWNQSTTDAERARVRLAQGDLSSNEAPEIEEGAASRSRESRKVARTDLGAASKSRAGTSAQSFTARDAAQAGVAETAENYYRQAIDLARDDPETRTIAVNNLAVLWMGSRRWTEAADLLALHRETVPAEARPLYSYNHGLALEGSGQLPRAFAAYARAVIEQPDFREAYEGVARLTGRGLLPESATLAVDVVQALRGSDLIDRAEALLASFLELPGWFELPAYESLLAELLQVLSSERRSGTEPDLDWPPRLDDLGQRLPARTAAKVGAVGQALRPSGDAAGDDPWAAWRDTPVDRERFSTFLKRLGDLEFRRERWPEALERYGTAWDVDPGNLDAATYLLTVLAVGPRELDPEGQLSAIALASLQSQEFEADAPEIAGTFQIAGEALERRDLLDGAVLAWRSALELSPEDSALYPALQAQIASAEGVLENSGEGRDTERPERRFQERREMPEQLAAGPKWTVAVLDFDDRSGGSWDELGEEVADLLKSDLLATERIVLVEWEPIHSILGAQGFNFDNAKAGHLTVDAVILGTIRQTEVGKPSRARGFMFRKSGIGKGKTETTVTVDLRLVEVSTGRVLASKTVQGSSHRYSPSAAWSGTSGGGGDRRRRSASKSPTLRDEEDLLREAGSDAIREALPFLLESMAQLPWQSRIVKVDGDRIYIDAGRPEGLSKDLELTILQLGELLIDPETAEVLGRAEEEIGRLRIEEVRERYAIGRIIAGGGGVRKGDVVRLAQ